MSSGVIDAWRNTETGIFSDDDGEHYHWAGEPDDDGNGNKVSRAGRLPTPSIWYQVFDSPISDDYEWTDEDWQFIGNNWNQYTIAQQAQIAFACYNPDVIVERDIDPSIFLQAKREKKLDETKARLHKIIRDDPDFFSNTYWNNNNGKSQLLKKVNQVDFILLVNGNLEDTLDDSSITRSNGYATFVTEINKQLDKVLKRGVPVGNSMAARWVENDGALSHRKGTQDIGWWAGLFGYDSSTVSDFLINPDEDIEDIQAKYEEILGSEHRTYATPAQIGKKVASPANLLVAGSEAKKSFVEDGTIYNGKSISIADNLTNQKIEDTGTYEKLKEKIGGKNVKTIVIPNGINNTNLLTWAKTSGETSLFVPSFSNSLIFSVGSETSLKDTATEQQKNFISKFAYIEDVTDVKTLIINSYQSAWVGYVNWYINQKKNNNKERRYNQIETRKFIALEVARGLAPIFALVYDTYETAAIWTESTLLINSGDQTIDDEELDSALSSAQGVADASINNALQGGGIEEQEQLTDEQLKERQKFVKQCILMYNLELLRDNYRSYIKSSIGSDEIHKTGPFNFRMHCLTNNDSNDSANNLVTKLQMAPQQLLKPLLEITPDIQAFLVPKIRLFKVFSSSNGLGETEFVFDKVEDKRRIDQLLSAQFDRGNSYGIKNFNFSFEGTTPATARNDITADLSLYFQSFSELIRTRNHGQNDYRIIDLLIFPINPNNRSGTRTIRAEEYDPSYYRIRADVGWFLPENNPALSGVLSARGFSYDQLKNAILSMNKSLYLNMVDHEIDMKDDGSCEVKINYRAYIESRMKSNNYDALSSVTLRKNREKFKQAMAWAITDNNCSKEELKTLKELFQRAEEELVKSTYKSLLKRLNERNKIFFVDVDPSDIKSFRKNGYFPRNVPPKLVGVNSSSGVVQQGNVVDQQEERQAAGNNGGGTNPDLGGATVRLIKNGVEDYSPESLTDDNRINFFYLGDLIYCALDSVYEDDGTLRRDIEKTAVLLGSFDTADSFATDASKKFNIIDIPVSVEYFFEWFTENVIKTKRLTFPIMDFIRELTNDLVIKLLFDSCGRSPVNTKMRFNTGNFLAIGAGQNNDVDVFKDISNSFKADPEYPVIDVAIPYRDGRLPFLTDKQGTANINNFFNYVLIYPVKSSSMYGGVGNFFVDGSRGVHHFTVGSNKGLVKKIKLSKTDIAYGREARFFRNGFDGLQQISAVYKASIEMYGNTLYYPGMELFIDAVGVGGPDFRSQDRGSLANILGFGGYHLVTRVNSSISSGKFSTTIEAQWFHSGAKGEPTLHTSPQQPMEEESGSDQVEATESLEERPRTTPEGGDSFTTNCSPLVSSLEMYVEAVKESPLTDTEFHPDIGDQSGASQTSPNNANEYTTATQNYSDTEAGDASNSNINVLPDSGE